ncbi:HD-GYP domain-containing protein [Acidaminobacter sp. JC074]|uniref:HD-GYP domain-containing protein n=1 Tax=Acidaminobacter sp. JC074 TaxID=2530199 RepID=UPI001F0F216E|nr:HD-GYP domain-containing protein [Acidaminobacter sp. JC074]MCH4889660.1 HD-GYP domain-containing protein [Acidaminobacter sp. JC074]
MKSARVSEILIGNMIAEPVYSEQGNLLLKEGVVINKHVLNKLLAHEIDYVYIFDALMEDIEPKSLIREEKLEESVRVVKHVFDDVLHNERMGVKSGISKRDILLVKNVVDELLRELENAENILYTVVDLIGTDAYTYKHSVNVTVLSIIVAKALGYDKADIKNIAMGALLHDIGKVRVESELILKPGKLTFDERKRVEKHPSYGYELLEAIEGLSYTTKQIILLHHEKLDGSGYPYGLRGIEIPPYVRIVTVCDMYDAMTTDRVYRNKMPIYRALDILMAEAIYRIDPEVYSVLLGNIAVYPEGTGIILSDGRIGVVMKYRHKNPARPIVRVLNNHLLSGKINVELIDLEQSQILFIEDVWDVKATKEERLEAAQKRNSRVAIN